MEKQNSLQQLTLNAANTSVGSDSSSLKNRKKEILTENLTDFIECKSIMVANLDSCHLFAMPKKGVVRLTRDQAKRAFFLELYMQKDKDNKRVINIEVCSFSVIFIYMSNAKQTFFFFELLARPVYSQTQGRFKQNRFENSE